MRVRLLYCVMAVTMMLILSIGIGFAYSASVTEESSFGSSYCSISANINGSAVQTVIVQSDSSLHLGFSSNGTDFQETLSLNYKHTRGTDLVLTIVFSCTVQSESPTISCLLDEVVVGSTLLTGEGTKSGIITGIILPVGDSNSGTVNFKFQVEGIDVGKSVQMSFTVHPLEVSS